MQVVVDLFFDEIAYKLIYAYAAQRERMAVFILGRRHHQRAEFDLRLTFKHRLNDAHGDGGNESVSNVLHVEVLAKMLLNRPRNVLLKGALMRAAQGRVLPVDERIILFAILRSMRKGYIYIVSFQMDNRIESGSRHIIIEQIFQTVPADNAPAVEEDCQAGVEVGIVAQHHVDRLIFKVEVEEEFGVGFKVNIGAVLFVRVFVMIFLQTPAFKRCLVHPPFAITAHDKLQAQCIDGFQADAVKSHAGREDRSIVFRPGVQL